MRTVQVSEITENIKEMCIEANHYLSRDMEAVMERAAETEEAPLGKQILGQLRENLEIAARDMIPHLPGHGHGGRLSGNRAGRASGGRTSGGCCK